MWKSSKTHFVMSFLIIMFVPSISLLRRLVGFRPSSPNLFVDKFQMYLLHSLSFLAFIGNWANWPSKNLNCSVQWIIESKLNYLLFCQKGTGHTDKAIICEPMSSHTSDLVTSTTVQASANIAVQGLMGGIWGKCILGYSGIFSCNTVSDQWEKLSALAVSCTHGQDWAKGSHLLQQQQWIQWDLSHAQHCCKQFKTVTTLLLVKKKKKKSTSGLTQIKSTCI